MHSGNQNTTALMIDGLVSLLESPPILAKLNTQEREALQSLVISESSYAADTVIIDQGACIRSVHLVRSGWGCVHW